MSTVEDFIYHRLTSAAAVSAVVGTRVYRVKMPDNPQLPAITYHTILGEQDQTFDGPSDLRNPVIGIDCWAETAGQAQALAEAVRGALHGYGGTYSDVLVRNVTEWSTQELYDAETEIYHVSASCRVWYSNT